MSVITTTRQTRLLSRLNRDLQELSSNPYPGIEIFHHSDTDLRRFCLHLSPPCGAYAGIRLHFNVTLPESWPIDPPLICSDSRGIQHPNVFRDFICCDLLKRNNLYRSSGYTGGYTPAFTLRGLFIQFLSFFTSQYVDQEHDPNGRVDISRLEHRICYLKFDQIKNILFDIDVRIKEDAIDKVEELDLSRARQGYLKGDFMNQAAPGKAKVLVCERWGFRVWKWERGNDTVEVEYSWSSYRRGTWCCIKDFECLKCFYGRVNGGIPIVTETANNSYQDDAFQQLEAIVGAMANSAITKNSSLSLDPVVDRKREEPLKAKCCLPILPPEIFLYLATNHLPSESIISLGKAYPPFHAIYQENHILLLRELRCFFLHTPLHCTKTILGIGIHLNRPYPTNPDGPTSLESTFDYLSLEAFQEFRIRESVTERSPFEFFLPLAFSPQHFAKIVEVPKGATKNPMSIIWIHLRELTLATFGVRALDNATNVEEKMMICLNPLWKICNGVVVGLMKEADEAASPSTSSSSLASPNERNKTLLYASERAAIGYLQIYHLLVMLMKHYPSLRSRLASTLREFASDPEKRAKGPNGTKDLGEFLVKVAVINGSAVSSSSSSSSTSGNHAVSFSTIDSQNLSYSVVARPTLSSQLPPSRQHFHVVGNSYTLPLSTLFQPFILEAFTRNIRWVLKTFHVSQYPPPHKNLTNTFSASKIGLRLIMFQFFFLREIAGARGLTKELERNYGYCREERRIPQRIVEEIRKIYGVNDYAGFFERLGWGEGRRWCEGSGFESGFTSMEEVMVWCFEESARRGYHRGKYRIR